MKTSIRGIISSLSKIELIKGSLWLTIGGFVVSLENYLFNLLMGRFLTPSEYGVLTSLISLVVIISLPSSIIITTTSKFSAKFLAKKDHKKITRMIKKFTYYTCILGIIIIIIFLLFNPLIQQFLKIYDSKLIIVTGVIIAISLISSVNQGVLRGLLLFKFFTILGFIGATTKLIFGWYFVSLGWTVFGALLAGLIATVLPWGLSFLPIRQFFVEKTKKIFGLRQQILFFSLPAFYVITSSILFLTSDVILVKHFFTPVEAGIYAAGAIMGKAIFFAISPISVVLFSIISQKLAKGENLMKELLLSIVFTLIPGLIAISIYFTYPQFIVTIFFPLSEYRESVNLVGLYGVYMLIYSLASLLTNFFLAIEKNMFPLISLIFAILQIVLIFFFHTSLYQIIEVSIFSLSLLLAFLIWGAKSILPKRAVANTYA